MTTSRSTDYLVGLVRELCKLPRETEWLELKENNAEPHLFGEYLSALTNAAALEAGLVVLEDEAAAKSERRYLPWWARDGKALKSGGRR